MKIALLISGYLRGFIENLDNLTKYILNDNIFYNNCLY